MYLILAIILVFSVSRFYDLSFLAASSDSEWYKYITFQFIHNSFLHMMVNVIVIYLYWKTIKKHTIEWLAILIVATSSTLSGYLGASLPTIGASSIAFSLVGIYMVFIWNVFSKKELIKYYGLAILFLFIPPIINHSLAFLVHLYSLGISVSLSLIMRNVLYVRKK